MTNNDKKVYDYITELEPYCVLCGSPYIQLHHIFEGRNRKNSTKYGMIVPLCRYHHEWVHKTNYKKFKQEAQKEFEKTHTRDEFIKIFGKNYIY